MIGHKDKKGKFHPHTNSSTVKGVKSSAFSKGKSSHKFKKPEFVPAKQYSEEQQEIIKDIRDTVGGLCGPKEIEMSPKTFLHGTNADKNWIPPYGYDSVVRLKNRMENHQEIDKPLLVLDQKPNPKVYSDKVIKSGMVVDHEGRHRSFTAEKLGIEQIPVDVYCVRHGVLGCLKCKNITENTIKKAISQNYSESTADKLIKTQFEQAKHDLEEREKEKKEGVITRKKLAELFNEK